MGEDRKGDRLLKPLTHARRGCMFHNVKLDSGAIVQQHPDSMGGLELDRPPIGLWSPRELYLVQLPWYKSSDELVHSMSSDDPNRRNGGVRALEYLSSQIEHTTPLIQVTLDINIPRHADGVAYFTYSVPTPACRIASLHWIASHRSPGTRKLH